MSTSTVATTIVEQLGGPRALSLMIGVKHILTTDTSADIRFTCRNERRINHVRITLTPMDVYEVVFYVIGKGGLSCKEIDRSDDVHADSLVTLFERVTGLCLRLPGARR